MADQDVVKFYGVKETVKLMRQIEPEMLKGLRRDIRQVAAPGVNRVKAVAPKVAPLSGMAHNGRSAYTPPTVKVAITPGQRSRALGSTTANLASIVSTGSGKKYGYNIADIAGRGHSVGRRAVTREYVVNGKPRRHKINGQGQALIEALSRQAKPSRYFWKALDQVVPEIRRNAANVIERTFKDFERKLNG